MGEKFGNNEKKKKKKENNKGKWVLFENFHGKNWNLDNVF